jgi:type VII secretion-associated serine protease mycosin
MNRISWACRGAAAVAGALAACLVAAFGLLPGMATPAMAAPPPCQSPPKPGEPIRETPWHQKWLAPERVWPFSTGAGVRVAVIDSGTDATHPQLAGPDRVLTGYDELHGLPGGNLDCVGHGTTVASIIAAQRADGIGFAGLAPGAAILPVRISEKDVDASGNAKGEAVGPDGLARAIRWAVDNGARVVNLSVVVYAFDQALESAVAYARSKNVVLVAAVGNQHRTDGKPDPVPFPAALDGVIGVGAIDERGVRVGQSQVGPYVDLVAPGGSVVAATRMFGHNVWTGTSFATPMVSAAAALIIAAEPRITADEVAQRLEATADPSLGGHPSEAYGAGVLNLYSAVTERLNAVPPVVQPPLPDRAHDPIAAARADRWHRITQLATWLALGAGVVTAIVVTVAFVLPRGRRRRWRAVRPAAPAVPQQLDLDEPEELFFRVPRSSAVSPERT